MTADEKIAALLKESESLNPAKDVQRLSNIFAEAGSLVDRAAKPKKWAAFRYKYAQAIDPINPQAALDAYRESLAYFDPVQDHSLCAAINASIGYSLVLLGKIAPPESEEVIRTLEAAVGELPYVASTLALYFETRTIGDPYENWQKRVHYLTLALSQLSAQTEAVQWAALKNKLAVALTAEPDGNFAQATETRIEYHKEALAALESARPQGQNEWIRVCIDTSEAYTARISADRPADLQAAEHYARGAYDACGPSSLKDTRIFAAMGLARILLNAEVGSRARYQEGLRLCDEAAALIDAQATPVIAATNLKFKELAHLQLLNLGAPGQLDQLLSAADSAYQMLSAGLSSDLQRTTSQIAAEALVQQREYARAIQYLQRGALAAEQNLQQATTRAARLEAIFELHDTYAVLGYCHLQTGEFAKGVEAIDKGKGRWWNSAQSAAAFEQIANRVPAGGALLFPTFAPKDGVIAVVAEHGTALCQLNGVGHEKLKDLLLGDIRNPSGQSWIGRYLFRRTNPSRWQEAIDSIGSELFSLFWQPLLQTLSQLGVKEGAELVWFPQAGLGVLPLHAAWQVVGSERVWICDRYAIRYAPSASCFARTLPIAESAHQVFISDPLDDLKNSALELAWVQKAQSQLSLTILAGAGAQKKSVVNELRQANAAYFSTHAVFDVSDPFQSCIVLAGGEKLTLEELLPILKSSGLRQVVLSGCETAMSQVARRPDEFLGFPAAFLEHGASTVIATQWPIDDWATAALMGRFYMEWRQTPQSAAQALRSAQRWLRTVTAAELLEQLLPLKQQGGSIGAKAAEIRTSLRAFSANATPFSHPYYWAGFTVSG